MQSHFYENEKHYMKSVSTKSDLSSGKYPCRKSQKHLIFVSQKIIQKNFPLKEIKERHNWVFKSN